MMPDDDTCYGAMMRRDARFDGVFFTTVKTTGVYCRPICPAPKSKRINCRFVPSAAAAESMGFRACQRCRPESAPGSPAWLGVGATLARALRLIEEGALDNGSVDGLAERLGIGGRHLRRLFTDHLGASPKAVAQTHRLHLARRLVENTALPMPDVAAAAGFGSVRRFNDAFSQTFHETPSARRRHGPARRRRRPDSHPAEEAASFHIHLSLATRPPFDVDHLFAFLGARAIAGVETGDAQGYARVLRTGGGPTVLRVAPLTVVPGSTGPGAGVEAWIWLTQAQALRGVIQQVRHIFDLDADSTVIDETLAGDALLGPATAARPGIRVPGGPDPFEFTVRAVVGQQISVKGARTIAARLVARLGRPLPVALAGAVPGLERSFPTPEDMIRGDLDGLGLTTRRVATLKAVAGAFLASAPGLPDLQSIPGIGPWTAHYVAMRALGDPDAFPDKDLGLLKALGLDAKGGGALMAQAEQWRPYRAYAAIRLWQSLEVAP
ncbi:MAG: AlkA N-terminal domain-containing protein [Alphaproteobacteria bacterium]